MCDVKAYEDPPDSGNVIVKCMTTGKDVTETGEYGMFCEDFCDLEEAKESRANLDAWLTGMLKADGVF